MGALEAGIQEGQDIRAFICSKNQGLFHCVREEFFASQFGM